MKCLVALIGDSGFIRGRCFTIGILTCLLGGSVAPAHDDALATRFRQEAPAAWARCSEEFSRLQANTSTKRYDLANGRAITEASRLELKKNRSAWLWFLQEMGPKVKTGRCLCANEKYRFDIKRKADESDWVLTNYAPVGQLSKGFNVTEDMAKKSGPIWVDTFWLPEFAVLPEFKVGRVESEKHGKAEFVRVHFAYSPPNNQGRHLRDGWIELDPSRLWCVVQFDVVAASGRNTANVSGVYEFSDRSPGRPHVTRFVRRIQSPKEGVDEEVVNDFKYEDRSVPESEFTLSSFGLPEPVGFSIPRSTVPAFVWFLTSAGACTFRSCYSLLRPQNGSRDNYLKALAMLLWLSRVLVVLSIALAGLAVWWELTADMVAAEKPLEVHWPPKDLGKLDVGNHDIAVQITNGGQRSRRILGMPKACGPVACISQKADEPVTIPPGGTGEFLCLLEIRQTGSFEVTVHLFLEENGIREVETTLRGFAVPKAGGRSGRHASK